MIESNKKLTKKLGFDVWEAEIHYYGLKISEATFFSEAKINDWILYQAMKLRNATADMLLEEI